MASTYLRKAFSTTGDRQKFSLSMWFKRGSGLGVEQMLCECYSGSSAKDEIWLQSNDTLNFVKTDGGGLATTTSAVFRDTSAWYHIVIAADSTQGSNADRIKIYKNGVQQTLAQQDTIPVNSNFQFGNTGTELTFGVKNDLSWYFNGSMANVEMVDGQQLTPAYFGSTDSNTGIWTPQASSTISSYGTNGFKLKMDTTSPGADTSGKSNTFTPSGTPTLLQGSPSNNWCTLNPLAVFFNSTNPTFSNGNLTANFPGSNQNPSLATMGITTGKWYWETKFVSLASGTAYALTGITAEAPTGSGGQNFLGGFGNSYGYGGWNGTVYNSAGSTGNTSGGATYTTGDILSMAYDADNNRLYYYKNGAIQNSGTGIVIPAAADTIFGAWFPALGEWGSTSHVWSCNFGEGFFGTTAAGTQADDNGQGLFAYDVPAGYYALNTKNLEAYG